MTDAKTPSTDPEQIAQTTRYTSYTVFRRISGLTEDGEVTTEQITAALGEVTSLIETASDGDVEILGFYDVSGFRAEDDLMLCSRPTSPIRCRPRCASWRTPGPAPG